MQRVASRFAWLHYEPPPRWRILRPQNLVALLCMLLLLALSFAPRIEQLFSRAAVVEERLLMASNVIRAYANGNRGERYPTPTMNWSLQLPSPDVYESSIWTGSPGHAPRTYATTFASIDPAWFPPGEFYYFGYLMVSPEQYKAYFDAYEAAASEGTFPFENDNNVVAPEGVTGLFPIIERGADLLLGVPRSLREEAQNQTSRLESPPKLYQLREGIERFVMPGYIRGRDFRGRYIPILIERPRRYGLDFGGHVLYLDGSVRFVEYPGDLPMTEAIWKRIDELEALRASR